MLSDRQAPDYRNSIKESISAVESLVKQITGSDKGTLGSLLKHMPALHKDMRLAFEYLYKYSSDEDGIRHAIMEKDILDFHDAKFMLVTCSAFINFVEGKRTDNLIVNSSEKALESA